MSRVEIAQPSAGKRRVRSATFSARSGYHQGFLGDRILHLHRIVQETTRSDRNTVAGKRDELRGLKENVIVGKSDPSRYRLRLSSGSHASSCSGRSAGCSASQRGRSDREPVELLNAGLGGSDDE